MKMRNVVVEYRVMWTVAVMWNMWNVVQWWCNVVWCGVEWCDVKGGVM